MKKKLLSVMLALCMASGTATCPYSAKVTFAAKQTAGDFDYWVNDDGTLEVAFYSGNSSNIVIPSKVSGKKVTGIGGFSFYNRKTLTSVTIPDTVTNIGECAFSRCENLTDVTIPNGLLCIEKSAFAQCTGLLDIRIPSRVKNIETGAFSGCTSLKSINVDINNQSYSSTDGVLYSKDMKKLIQCPAGKTGGISIPKSVASIEENAFWGCSNITSVAIPESVTDIHSFAFSACTNLKNIVIPESVTKIGKSIFSNCTSLTGAVISANVANIEEAAFFGCTNLTSVIIPNSVKYIGNYAFQECSNLKVITIKSMNLKSVGNNALSGINAKAKIRVPSSKAKLYKKLLKNKGQGNKVKVIKY